MFFLTKGITRLVYRMTVIESTFLFLFSKFKRKVKKPREGSRNVNRIRRVNARLYIECRATFIPLIVSHAPEVALNPLVSYANECCKVRLIDWE